MFRYRCVFALVVLRFIFSLLSQVIGGKEHRLKLPILCWMGRKSKTLPQSIIQSGVMRPALFAI